VYSDSLTGFDSTSWLPNPHYTSSSITSPAKRRFTNESQQSFHSTHQSHDSVKHILSIDDSDDSGIDPNTINEGSPIIGQPDTIDSLLHAAEVSDLENDYPANVLNTPISNSISSPPSQTHIESIQEACLMRYFIDNLACWFDLTDPARHFALDVPARALQ
jgi:hypothetical protein